MVEFFMDPVKPARMSSLTPSRHHQELPFHLFSEGTFYMGEKYFTRREGLNNYLLLVTNEGCGSMNWQGSACELPPGCAVLIDCNGFHQYQTIPGQHWFFDFIHFGALSMEGYRSVFLDKLTPVFLRSPGRIRELLNDMRQTADRSSVTADIQISNQISNLLTEMVCSLSENAENPMALNRREIAELAEFMRINFAQDLHIEDFMKLTRLSRHYLIHIFKQQTGMSPYRYLHMCRINYAQVLLKTTELSISEIAYQVGYNHPAVFIRHFKFFHRMTPSVYRNESIRIIR